MRRYMPNRSFNAILDYPVGEIWPGVIERTDFRQVLKFFRLLDDDELDEQEKFYYMLRIFFNDPPKLTPQQVIDAVLDFISGGKKSDGGESKKTFDWNIDHGRLFAAFWQAYRIDLRTVQMHWWAFNELFQNLPDETRLMQVIELRGRKPAKSDGKESREALRKAQAAVALESAEEDQNARLDDFFAALTRGSK